MLWAMSYTSALGSGGRPDRQGGVRAKSYHGPAAHEQAVVKARVAVAAAQGASPDRANLSLGAICRLW